MIKQYEALVDHWRDGVLVSAGETVALAERAAKYDVIARRLKPKDGEAGEGTEGGGAPAAPGAPAGAPPEVFATGQSKRAAAAR